MASGLTGGSGYLGGSGALRIRGQGNACGPRQGSERGPAAWGAFGILRGIQPCCAFRRSLAVPRGTSMARLRPLSALRSREGGGGADRRSPGWPWGSGRRGLAGMGTPAAWQGSGRGPAAWEGFRFFSGEFNQAASSGALMLFHRHIHAAPFGAPLLFGSGKVAGDSGFFWEPGRCGLAGIGAPAARQGSGRSPRQGMGSGLFL